MQRKPFDPLTYIPSAQTVEKHLRETEQLAERLRVLLRVAQEIERTSINKSFSAHEVSHGR